MVIATEENVTEKLSPEDLVNPFIRSTEYVFDAMLGLETHFSELQEVTEGHQMYAVTSVVGLSGKNLTGSISISFQKCAALKVLELMAGIECDEVDESVRDAIGEMANMIGGQGKRDLSQYELQLGLPQVIVGEDYTVYSPRWARHYYLPIKTDIGLCTLDIGFDPTGS
ncbi:hypothetical protein MNBD_PLANCTO02-3442 [hydrothermal vent metagenome]|uniref:Chemotaxis phosphatase CheX-like domain-containing protein n=1 Tax=hydrothermal vent metagenome TaxID=652676 RepID=A0A3B1DBV9_9ZZZZ